MYHRSAWTAFPSLAHLAIQSDEGVMRIVNLFTIILKANAAKACLDDSRFHLSAPENKKTLPSQGRKGCCFRGTTLFRPARSLTALGETITSLNRLCLSRSGVADSFSTATPKRRSTGGSARAFSR